MCGRAERSENTATIIKKYNVTQTLADLPKSYNIAPTQAIAAIYEPDGDRTLDALRWGWERDWSTRSIINATVEKVADSHVFKGALRERRCIIPITGFYEWQGPKGSKRPMNIHLPDRSLFALAGLWEDWKSPEGELVRACTIITTPPNELMASIHNRMPAILQPDDIDEWLNPRNHHVPDLLELLGPYGGELIAHEVSNRVNRAGYDAPDCVEPLVA